MLAPKIAVVGVGGAGCRIVDSMALMTQAGPFFTVISTDMKTLTACKISSRMRIGEKTDSFLGIAGDPLKGAEAANFSRNEIKNLFSDVDIAFLVAGLGGGTGSGATPVIIDIARECGVMTIAVVVMPFPFEGESKEGIARKAFEKIKKKADVVVRIPNSRLADATEGRLKETMTAVTELISKGICGIWKTIAKSTFLGFDFDDLQAIVRDTHGVCTFAFGEGSGKEKAEIAGQALMESPMLENGAVLQNTSAIIISLIGGPDLTVSEVEKVISIISNKVPVQTKKLTGVVMDENWRNRLMVMLMVAEDAGNVVDDGEVLEEVKEEQKSVGGKPFSRLIGVQANLDLISMMEKGRFKNIEPTYWGESNLDVPTFIRKKIVIKSD